MGYYKDTGSLQSMASAEAILKKRMPEKVGILPVAELLFVAESMWVGEHDMKGHFHPSFRFVKAKRYNVKPHVLIELDGETLADINGRSKYYEGFSRCVDRKPEEFARRLPMLRARTERIFSFTMPTTRLQGTTQLRPPSQYLRFSLTGSWV